MFQWWTPNLQHYPIPIHLLLKVQRSPKLEANYLQPFFTYLYRSSSLRLQPFKLLVWPPLQNHRPNLPLTIFTIPNRRHQRLFAWRIVQCFVQYLQCSRMHLLLVVQYIYMFSRYFTRCFRWLIQMNQTLIIINI